MTSIEFARWTLDIDIESTRGAQAAMGSGGTDKCDCDACKNFASQRDSAYPADMLAFLKEIGVDYRHEVEAAHTARIASGNHLYIGWFYCVGRIISEAIPRPQADKTSPDYDRLSEHFMLKIRPQSAYKIDAFNGLPVLEIDFCAELPWIIDAAEPE